MGSPFVGEIRIVGYNFAPVGWAFCAGQTMAIAQNEALFDLIGTTYGGDGVNTFNLPDLRSRVGVHQGTDRTGTQYIMGAIGGAETVTLLPQSLSPHTHVMQAAASANTSTPGPNTVIGEPAASIPAYANTPNATFDPGSVGPAGGSQPHENRPPFLTLNFIISLFGIFPSQN
jgi:microcystin-dependent protein